MLKLIKSPIAALMLVSLFGLAACGGSSSTVQTETETEVIIGAKVKFKGYEVNPSSSESANVKLDSGSSFKNIVAAKTTAARSSFIGRLALQNFFLSKYESSDVYIYDDSFRYYKTHDAIPLGEELTIELQFYYDGQLVLFGTKKFIMVDNAHVNVPLKLNGYRGAMIIDSSELTSILENGNKVELDDELYLFLGSTYELNYNDGTSSVAIVNESVMYNYLEHGTDPFIKSGNISGWSTGSNELTHDEVSGGISISFDSVIDVPYQSFAIQFEVEQLATLKVYDDSYGQVVPTIYINYNEHYGETFDVYKGDVVIVQFQNIDELNLYIKLYNEVDQEVDVNDILDFSKE